MSKKHTDIRFHDYNYMVHKLHNKGLIIDSTQLSIEMIKARGYYNLINRYKEEFYVGGKKIYQSDIHLSDLYYYHRLEDDIRNILFKFTIIFEQRLKEAMAYILAKNFGVNENGYLDPYKYRNKNKAKSITKFLLNQIKNCSGNPTLYYKDEYGIVPPWILLSNTTLGQTRMLLSIFPKELTQYVTSELLPIHDSRDNSLSLYSFSSEEVSNTLDRNNQPERQEKERDILVERKINELIEFTRNMISIIHDFRNALAHANRITHFTSKQRLNFSAVRMFAGNSVFTDSEFYNKGLGKNDLFAFMMALTILLDKYDSIYFIDQLLSWEKVNTSNKSAKRSFSKFVESCSLPSDFVARLKNIKIETTLKQQNAEFDNFFN